MIWNGAAVAKSLQQKPANSEEQFASASLSAAHSAGLAGLS
jgi:hypothetical protein